MAPWMSASEALTIWMLSTAMKAPSVDADHRDPALERRGGLLTGGACRFGGDRAWPARRRRCRSCRARSWSGPLPAGGQLRRPRRRRAGCARPARSPWCRWSARPTCRAEQPGERVSIEHDLDRDALDDLGEVAGRVVGRQQGEFEAARRRQAVDMAAAASTSGKPSTLTSTGWPSRTWVSWVSLKLATT